MGSEFWDDVADIVLLFIAWPIAARVVKKLPVTVALQFSRNALGFCKH
jgi:hypothetical protein